MLSFKKARSGDKRSCGICVGRALLRQGGHGARTGYYSGYKFTVQRTGENRWMAIFLDCSKELRTVGETAESFRAFAEERGHALRLAIAPGVTYTGDEYAVRQLVSILLDNAVKYASEGTPIDFSMERRRKGLVLTCRNDCAPIPPEKLQRLFDRFYRADPSRSAGTGGFGLGLSVARSIAEGHHGSARAHCPTEHSVEFVLELR